jgi:hypothetical protein
MALSLTIAASPRQSSHSQVRVPRDSWPHFTVSDSRLPQPGRPGPPIYIPQEQGGPVIAPGAEQSRAKQSSNLLPATSQYGHSWHRAPLGPMAIYLFSVKTFFFFSSFVVPPLIKGRGWAFL